MTLTFWHICFAFSISSFSYPYIYRYMNIYVYMYLCVWERSYHINYLYPDFSHGTISWIFFYIIKQFSMIPNLWSLYSISLTGCTINLHNEFHFSGTIFHDYKQCCNKYLWLNFCNTYLAASVRNSMILIAKNALQKTNQFMQPSTAHECYFPKLSPMWSIILKFLIFF